MPITYRRYYLRLIQEEHQPKQPTPNDNDKTPKVAKPDVPLRSE